MPKTSGGGGGNSGVLNLARSLIDPTNGKSAIPQQTKIYDNSTIYLFKETYNISLSLQAAMSTQSDQEEEEEEILPEMFFDDISDGDQRQANIAKLSATPPNLDALPHTVSTFSVSSETSDSDDDDYTVVDSIIYDNSRPTPATTSTTSTNQQSHKNDYIEEQMEISSLLSTEADDNWETFEHEEIIPGIELLSEERQMINTEINLLDYSKTRKRHRRRRTRRDRDSRFYESQLSASSHSSSSFSQSSMSTIYSEESFQVVIDENNNNNNNNLREIDASSTDEEGYLEENCPQPKQNDDVQENVFSKRKLPTDDAFEKRSLGSNKTFRSSKSDSGQKFDGKLCQHCCTICEMAQ